MRTQQFNLSKKPLLDDDNVAYLVDSRNVELYRNYVEKYYGNHDVNWFDDVVLKAIRNHKHIKLIFYYKQNSIGFDYNIKSCRAYRDNFTIYYITNTALITVE